LRLRRILFMVECKRVYGIRRSRFQAILTQYIPPQQSTDDNTELMAQILSGYRKRRRPGLHRRDVYSQKAYCNRFGTCRYGVDKHPSQERR